MKIDSGVLNSRWCQAITICLNTATKVLILGLQGTYGIWSIHQVIAGAINTVGHDRCKFPILRMHLWWESGLSFMIELLYVALHVMGLAWLVSGKDNYLIQDTAKLVFMQKYQNNWICCPILHDTKTKWNKIKTLFSSEKQFHFKSIFGSCMSFRTWET